MAKKIRSAKADKQSDISKIRHSASHILAEAVLNLYPKTKLAIGPAVEDGFYYDLDFPTPPEEKELEKIEAEAKRIIKEGRTFKCSEMPIDEAIEQAKAEKQPYKTELLEDLKVRGEKIVSFYSSVASRHAEPAYRTGRLDSLAGQVVSPSLSSSSGLTRGSRKEKKMDSRLRGNDREGSGNDGERDGNDKNGGEDDKKVSSDEVITFTDLCAGPHVDSTSEIGAFKITKLAGAYWRGDEKNKQLTRIYGTAYATQKELDAYLLMLEEAKKRDHRRLGQELDLFSLHEEAGSGLVYWHPKGSRVRKVVEDFWREEHIRNGYEILFTPHIGKAWLWETSGHLGYYNENMYSPMEIDKDDYYIKPMNCPFHILMYKTRTRSYRDLPMRWAELGTVYRYERSGVLYGLLRVRGFTQDDAHIFCTPEQIEDEVSETLRFSLSMWKAFGFTDIKAYLATKPEKSVGDSADWDIAIESLRKAIDKEGLEYEMDEGGGAFYGPKIDLKIKDALGREWQMTTIQFDFTLPERFDMTFVDATGKERRPFMVHRALLGSIERFFGVLIEHYAGAFPIWLAPVQVKVLPISEKHLDYGRKVYQELREAGFRAELDESNESVGKKIREAEMNKIPYMLVVGDKEKEAGTVAVRSRAKDDLGAMAIKEFVKLIHNEINAKK